MTSVQDDFVYWSLINCAHRARRSRKKANRKTKETRILRLEKDLCHE